MLCRECPDCQEYHHGDGTSRHICAYTGVTVATLTFSPDSDPADNGARRVTDDQRAFCPVTMAPLLGCAEGRAMVRGVLRGIQERGELERLLETYPAYVRGKLGELV